MRLIRTPGRSARWLDGLSLILPVRIGEQSGNWFLVLVTLAAKGALLVLRAA